MPEMMNLLLRPPSRRSLTILMTAQGSLKPCHGTPSSLLGYGEAFELKRYQSNNLLLLVFTTMGPPLQQSDPSRLHTKDSVNSGPSHPHDDPGAQTMPHH
jgi:hypothetical protein